MKGMEDCEKSEIYLRSIDAARIGTVRIDAAQIDAVLDRCFSGEY